jgi:NAD(P)H-nitrite reductase large subunit
MTREHHVILGDGIAGATAAGTLREQSDEVEITVLTDEGDPLYNRVQVKEVTKGTKGEDDIRIHDTDWYEKRDIDLRLFTRVKRVDDENDTVITESGERVEYDKLLIAAGGRPRKYPAPNSQADGIHTFWTLQDAREILESERSAGSGAIVGAGLLGMDLAVSFGYQDISSKYVMRGNRWWREGVNKEGSKIVEDALWDMGVEPTFHESVTAFEVDDRNHVTAVKTDEGNTYESDIVGVAIGLNFNMRFLSGSNLTRGEGLLCNEYLQTSLPDIFAAGDICQYYDVLLNRVNMNGSWASAKAQGEIAARNMLADDEEEMEAFEHVDFYSISHFDFPVMSVGSVLGDQMVEGKPAEDTYYRFIFKGERMVGAVFIGDAEPLPFVKKAVRNKTDVSGMKKDLVEPDFEYAELAK